MAKKIVHRATLAMRLMLISYRKASIHTPLVSTYYKLKAEGWDINITDTNNGRCHYATKELTVPLWAWMRGVDYAAYYLAHEMAHATAGHEAKHGPQFMAEFKRICPRNSWHYELEYKPRLADAAGIMPEDFGPTKPTAKRTYTIPAKDRVPTFAAHRQDKSLKPHILRAFLRSIKLTQEDIDIGWITLPEDRTEWIIILDDMEIAKELTAFGSCYCIVSFQVWSNKRNYAVARKDTVGRKIA